MSNSEESGEPAPSPQLSWDLYRGLVESVTAVTYVLPFGQAGARPVYVSPQSEAVLGMSPAALMVETPERMKLVHPDDRPRLIEHASQVDAKGVWDEEYRVVLPTGLVRWIHDQARVVPAEGDRPALWFGTLTDHTRTNGSRPALADPEARYQALVEQMPAIVYIDTYGENPVSLYVSPQTQRITGYRPTDWIADPGLFLRVVVPEDRDLVQRDWPHHLDRDDELALEYRIFHRDGHVVWLKDVAHLVRAADGMPLYWQGVVLDVTDQHISQQRVRDSEARYRALVEDIPAVVYIAADEPGLGTTYISPQISDLLGYSPAEWLADPDLWLKVLHRDDIETTLSLWRSAVELRAPFVSEYRAQRRDGIEVWVRDVARLIRPVDSEAPFWQGVILDITKEKRAEEVLRASEARYRLLVEQVPAVVYEMSLDDERRTLFVSPQVEALFGYSRQEWLDQPDIWIELLHHDDREIELAAHDLHNETGEPWSQEYRLIASDGRIVWVRDQARLVRDEAGRAFTWQGVMLDITAQKHLEERLRETNDELEFRVLQRTAELEEANEMMALEIGERQRAEADLRDARERYRSLAENIPAVAYIWQVGDDTENPQHYTSPRIEELLGYTTAEWGTIQVWMDRLHPHDRQRVLAAVSRSEITGEPFNEEYRILAKDGHVVWVLDSATLLSRDDRGAPWLFQGVFLDMTMRHRAEEVAERSERRHRELAERGPVIFYVYEYDGSREQPITLDYISPQIEDVTGCSSARLTTDPWQWLEIVHPDDRDWLQRDGERTWSQGGGWDRDFRLIGGDGRVVWVHDVGRVIDHHEHGGPRRLLGMLLDITQRKNREEQARADGMRLRSLVEQIPAVPWTKVIEDQTEWRLAFIGPQVEEMLGYTAEELIAEPRHFERILHPKDRTKALRSAAASARASQVWITEFRVIARGGREIRVRAVANPGMDEQGRAVMNGMWFDVTGKRGHAGLESFGTETARMDG